jgi:hypothetical protein
MRLLDFQKYIFQHFILSRIGEVSWPRILMYFPNLKFVILGMIEVMYGIPAGTWKNHIRKNLVHGGASVVISRGLGSRTPGACVVGPKNHNCMFQI